MWSEHRALFETVFYLKLLSRSSAGTWPDSSTNVHRFLTFDSGLNSSVITAQGHSFDFVWGAEPSHVPFYRNCTGCSGKHIVLTSYMPYSRDCTHGDAPEAIAWYQENHPSWVTVNFFLECVLFPFSKIVLQHR